MYEKFAFKILIFKFKITCNLDNINCIKQNTKLGKDRV